MTLPKTYSTGTVSVANGATTVTGVGTAWLSAVAADDVFRRAGLTVRIASVDSDTQITLAEDWPGTTLSGSAYEIAIVYDGPEFQLKSRQIWDELTTASVVTKSGAFTISVGDNRSLFLCDASSAAFTAGIVSAATAGENFTVSIKKTDSSSNAITIDPSGAETIDGATTFVLDAQYEEIKLQSDGSNWHAVGYYSAGTANSRIPLTADTTWYVRSDGDDNNDGLTDSSGGAKATWQAAYDHVSQNFDLMGFTATIKAGDEGSTKTFTGTYGIYANKPWVGGKLVIDGGANDAVISTTNYCLIFDSIAASGPVQVQNIKLTSSGASLIRCHGNVVVLIGDGVNFGSTPSSHMWANQSGSVIQAVAATYTISGGAVAHAEPLNGSTIFIENCSVTITGTPAFTSFLYANAGHILIHGNTWTGSATGQRWWGQPGGSIQSNGEDLDSVTPGSTNGYANGVSNAGKIYWKTSSSAVSLVGSAADLLLDLSASTAGQVKLPATQNPSSDANTLDDYEEGTWTPGVAFGGGSTGVTYDANNQGYYVKIGRAVFVFCHLNLSSKGTDTGNAVITGLPFSTVGPGAAYQALTFGWFSGLASMTTGGPLALVVGATNTINLYKPGTASAGVLTDANFTNSAHITISGWLLAAQ